jgi:hypothetical protein
MAGEIGENITLERVEGVGRFAVKVNGERVEFSAIDKTDDSYDIEDMRGIWSAARNKYIDEQGDYFYRLRNNAKTKELKDAVKDFVQKEPEEKSSVDKYKQAIEKLKEMGIDSTRVEELLAQKQTNGMNM